MTPERWRQVEEIFHAALSRDERERVAFLAQACASDLALRREVEVLLARQASGFLEVPPVAAVAETSSDAGDSLLTGRRLGSYQVHERIGVGGMGEVYRARDTKLGRDVAIKILPRLFTSDPDRLARFEREARVLASLNHPHIGAIYGLEDADGVQALVLELVDGETLADRIARGPIPVNDTLTIARQMADALDAAHEKGIVHRDLKPANIKITSEGVVKVLDFGLARIANTTDGSTSDSRRPTITIEGTREGLVMGTPGYMSPEQARGKPVDKRSDVWAFGCVLYEMLTGARAFEGDDVSDTMAAVLKSDPDWNALPSHIPPAVHALIQGCLRKDRKERIGDISTALFLFSQPDAVTPSTLVPPPRPWRRSMLAVAGAVISAAVAATAVWQLRPLPAVAVSRFVHTLPEGHELTLSRRAVALSPDGTHLAYAAEGRLYLRSISALEARAIPGTDAALNLAFSPDGQSLVFWSDSWLKRIAVTGGTAVTICQINSAPHGLAWGSEGILFSSLDSDIMRVSPVGGKPELLVDLDNSELAFSPQLLPGGGTLLFSTVKRAAAFGRFGDAQIVVQSLQTGVRKQLIEGGLDGRYVPTGHIVYAIGGTLFAVPFDLSRLEVSGAAVPVVEGIRRQNTRSSVQGGTAQFAFSDIGSLAYVPGPSSLEPQDLVLFDRKGEAQPLKLPPGRYELPRVSPDGNRIAFETSDGKDAVVAVYELSGASLPHRLTFGGNNRYPIWSGDGMRVAFQSDREGDSAVFWQPADGGKAERLTKPDPDTSHVPESWSPDGKVLLFSATKELRTSLWALSLADRKATPFSEVKGSSIPTNAMFSPDGRWVAYQWRELQSKGPEGITYVEPFPPTGTKNQIAQGGRPMWSRDGKELFYVPGPTRFMAITVTTAPSFRTTSPAAVLRGFGAANPWTPRTFDIMPDGRFVVVGTVGQNQSGSVPAQIHVVLNWTEELKRLVPTK